MWASFSPSWAEQKDWHSPRRVNSAADGPQPWTTTLALSWGSSLPAYPADSGPANLQNCVSQSLKTNFSLYWSLFHLQHCLSSTHTHTHTHPISSVSLNDPFIRIFKKSFFTFLILFATHSSILAWRIPWIEEQSMGLQRVRHDWRDLAHMHWIFGF